MKKIFAVSTLLLFSVSAFAGSAPSKKRAPAEQDGDQDKPIISSQVYVSNGVAPQGALGQFLKTEDHKYLILASAAIEKFNINNLKKDCDYTITYNKVDYYSIHLLTVSEPFNCGQTRDQER